MDYEREPISAMITTTFGKTIYTKSIGWSGHHSHLKPNHALYWAALMWAKSRKFEYCDLDGIDTGIARLITAGKTLSNEQMANPTFFKSGFGGDIYFYPETYTFIYRKFVRLVYKSCLSKLFSSRIINKLINIIRVAS
jgi:lipid II:glycine glycyltransferase (peptidoglycan interpeptide bridge formation enzyme)